jgi:hypothetical protein
MSVVEQHKTVIQRNKVCGYRLRWVGSEYGPVVVFFEQDNEHSSFISGEKTLGQLSDCQLLKKILLFGVGYIRHIRL